MAPTHPPNCDATHAGLSGSIEASSGIDMFNRSVQKYNLRYTHFTGDGDTNAYKSVAESRPYGETAIEKNWVRRACAEAHGFWYQIAQSKKDHGKDKMKDGKSIGGRGRLTATQIDQIKAYYGKILAYN